MPSRERGLRYPMEFVAAENGVDCETLRRRCEDAGYKANGTGITFAEAHDAWFQKSASESARRRKTLAEAESSELDTLNKRKKFVFREDHQNIVKDLAVQTRVKIESASYIPQESRRKLVKEIADIKPTAAEPSHK